MGQEISTKKTNPLSDVFLRAILEPPEISGPIDIPFPSDPDHPCRPKHPLPMGEILAGVPLLQSLCQQLSSFPDVTGLDEFANPFPVELRFRNRLSQRLGHV